MKPLGFFFGLLLLAGCSSEKKNNSFVNDYEQSIGWAQVPVIKGNAHSGSYAESITPDREFSHTFFASLAQIEPAQLLPLIIADVWVYGTKLSQPVTLVLQVTDTADGKVIAYKTTDLDTKDANGKWTNLILTHQLPANSKGSYTCKVFLWNPNKQTLLADDFRISFKK